MQLRAQRPELREALLSLAFALWCVAWPAGLVLAGGSTPGFLSLRGDAGLRELVEAGLPLSYSAALFAWGVLAFAGMWALLRLRRWLDPDGLSGAALRWAFSSRSLNLTVAALTLAALLLIEAGQSDSIVAWLGRLSPEIARFLVSWWWLILLIAFAILSPLLPLCLLNPHTLARDRLERWWRPFWPGFAALTVAIVCWWVMPTLATIVLDGMPASRPVPWQVILHALEYLLFLLCDLVVFAWWFSRGRLSDAKVLGAYFFRWSTLRAYVGFDLSVAAFVLVPIVPMLFMSAFGIYIAPQYVAWQESAIVDMPVAYGSLIEWAQDLREKMPGLLSLLELAGLLLVIAQGRLLYRCAVVARVIREPTHDNVDEVHR
jgi:hypothetical protein